MYSKLGLEIVYLYFQLPLMVLIIAPAIDGLKKDWREASESLGASTFQYWQPHRPADPAADPPRIDDLAVRQRLRGPGHGLCPDPRVLQLVTNLIGNQISRGCPRNTGLGFALAMGMVAIMAVAIFIYSRLQREPRAERWQHDRSNIGSPPGELEEFDPQAPRPDRRTRAGGATPWRGG